MAARGLFISLEGGDASGKSTHARGLRRRLTALGHPVLLVAEPGSTPLGRRLRRLLKSSQVAMSPETEALLFLAARAQLVKELLQPALAQGKVVVSDRYADSTLAYQGYGRGLDVDILRGLNRFATGGLGPLLTVLLDLPVEEAGRRRGPQLQDRFEAAGADGGGGAAFHGRVRRGFLALAQEEPARWLVVDASRPRREVAQAVWERVAPLLAD